MAVSQERLEAVRARYAAAGQEHVLQHAASLDEASLGALVAQLEGFDLELVARMSLAVTGREAAAGRGEEEKVTPFDRSTDFTRLDEAARARYWDEGLALVARGQVAVVLLAGGQGTRLGFDKPKGMYNIGLPSQKTLFEIQADKLHRLRALAAEAAGVDGGAAAVSLPWYVMTSPFTHAETEAYFREKQFFGLPEADVFFPCQATLPCLTPEGKIIMAEGGRVATAPNGNGGVYEALLRDGSLDDMERRGVRSVYMYCVDNVLAKVADPWLCGFISLEKADVVNKTVLKDDPHEKVGVMCYRNGAASVIEYSEISAEMAESRGDDGLLLYRDANIANHGFSLEFLRRMASTDLPFHLAHKKIPHAAPDAAAAAGWSLVRPEAPNGYKLEMFVFDVFGFADRCLAFSVAREGEFSPLKNADAPGGAKNSPSAAREDVSRYHAALVARAGGVVKREAGGAAFEISPRVSYDGEGLEALVAGKEFVAPFELKRE